MKVKDLRIVPLLRLMFEDRDTEDAYDYSIIKMGRDKYSRFPANIVRDSTGFIKYNGVFLEGEDGQQIKWSPTNLRKFKFLEDGYFGPMMQPM